MAEKKVACGSALNADNRDGQGNRQELRTEEDDENRHQQAPKREAVMLWAGPAHCRSGNSLRRRKRIPTFWMLELQGYLLQIGRLRAGCGVIASGLKAWHAASCLWVKVRNAGGWRL